MVNPDLATDPSRIKANFMIRIWIQIRIFIIFFLACLSVLSTPLPFLSSFCIFERCLDSSSESCSSKQGRCQLSHPSPHNHPSPIRIFTLCRGLSMFCTRTLFARPVKNSRNNSIISVLANLYFILTLL
jgi:hypothetical protein